MTKIDRTAKTVFADGVETHYDKLVITIGSAPFIMPIAGRDLPSVLAFRDLDDVKSMVAAADKPHARAVVIGGGTARAWHGPHRPASGRHLMERRLDPAAGYLLQRELEGRGIKVHC